ncbi:hypothetical protein [Streptomyces sp. NPDC001889]
MASEPYAPGAGTGRGARSAVEPLPHTLCWMLSGLRTAAVRALGDGARTEPPPGAPRLLAELAEAPAGRLDYRIPLVGPMKAGKSTLLNAIICQDLLPARGPAMTVLPTHVVPVRSAPPAPPVLTLHPATLAVLACLGALLAAPARRSALTAATRRHPQLAAVAIRVGRGGTPYLPARVTGREAVRGALTEVNDLLRLAALALPQEEMARETGALRAPEVTVPVPWLTSAPAGGRLVLADTPGPDEELRPGLLSPFVAAEVRRAHEVLVVADATRRGSTAEAMTGRLVADEGPGPGATFTVVNRSVPCAPGPDPALPVRTTAHQALAAAGVLWPGEDGDDGAGAAHRLLRTVFPLDWQERTALPAERLHTLARQSWDGSGLPRLMDVHLRDRARSPGGWALAALLARVGEFTGPPTAPPLAPPDGVTVLARRRARLVHAARDHYAGLPIEWR